MNRRQLLGGISSSFLVGTAGGALAGAIGGAALTYDHRSRSVNVSYAQQGEDLIVSSILWYLKIDRPRYLDIGAADPTIGNNTYLFYSRGFRGVLVEPNPSSCRELRRMRPGDSVLEAGIGASDGEADYYVMSGRFGEDGTLNTFSKAQADSLVASGEWRIGRILKMRLWNINRVMQEHFGGAPDFISIDTEGLDLEILSSLDFGRYRPAVICAEVLTARNGVENRIGELMRSQGYSTRGSTFVNSIFVDDRLPVRS